MYKRILCFFWRWFGLPLLVGVATFCLVAYHLGSFGLTETTEGRYASIARTMADGGSWLIPERNGVPYLAKPPLTYWAGVAGIKLEAAWRRAQDLAPSVPSEWGVKATLPVAAAFTAIGCYVIGCMWAGTPTGMLSALVLITSILFLGLFKGFTSDPFLTLCETWTVACLFAEILHSRWIHRFGFYLFAGLALVTKGPVGLLPLFALIPWLWWRGDRESLRRLLRFPVGWGVFAVVGLGWYGCVAATHPGATGLFLWDEIVCRIATTPQDRAEPWWYYVLVMLIGLFPWSILFLVSIEKALLRHNTLAPLQNQSLMIWIALPFVVFSISQSKQATYVLPLLVPCALLTGSFLARALFGDGEDVVTYDNAAVFSLVLVGLAGFALLIGAWKADLPDPRLAKLMLVVAAHLLFMAFFGLVFLQYGIDKGLVLVLALISPGLVSLLLPALPGFEGVLAHSYRPLLRETAARYRFDGQIPLVCVGRFLEALPFYTGGTCYTLDVENLETRFGSAPQRILTGPEGLAQIASWGTAVGLLSRDEDLDRLRLGLKRQLAAMVKLGEWGLYRPGDPLDPQALHALAAKQAAAQEMPASTTVLAAATAAASLEIPATASSAPLVGSTTEIASAGASQAALIAPVTAVASQASVTSRLASGTQNTTGSGKPPKPGTAKPKKKTP